MHLAHFLAAAVIRAACRGAIVIAFFRVEQSQTYAAALQILKLVLLFSLLLAA